VSGLVHQTNVWFYTETPLVINGKPRAGIRDGVPTSVDPDSINRNFLTTVHRQPTDMSTGKECEHVIEDS